MAGPVAFPAPGMELTHILVVRDLARSRDWYRDVLGATLTGEYGGSSAIFNFQGAWLLVVTPGGETPDKPGTLLSHRRIPRKSATASRSACRTAGPRTRRCAPAAPRS